VIDALNYRLPRTLNLQTAARDPSEKNTLVPPVLNLVGIHSPFIEESVDFNGQLTPRWEHG
jgi:hypothetical protein